VGGKKTECPELSSTNFFSGKNSSAELQGENSGKLFHALFRERRAKERIAELSRTGPLWRMWVEEWVERKRLK
jgi:hypothetical protein